MKDNSQLTLANRKQLADMLADKYESLRYRTKANFRQKVHDLRNRLINEMADKHGVTKLKEELADVQSEASQLEMHIMDKGFRISDGELDFSVRGTALHHSVEKQIEKELGTTEAIDARFDSAMIAIMTVPTLADAEKIMQSLQNM
jgi:hypothetical protein